MRLTSMGALVAPSLILALFGATSAMAMEPEARPDGGRLITPARMPVGMSHWSLVNVVVELAGDPVALRQAAAGRKLDRGEKEAIKNQLQGTHDAVQAGVESLGGTVLAHYKAAYNGIKVRIASDQVEPLRALPGVVAVHPVQIVRPSNIHGIPLIGAPTVWDKLGLHGEGMKIAVIDTGIDYTHANFGGPGTAAAYTAAHMNEALPADPTLFGPKAPRVKGGTDLVGDSYDADPNSSTYQPVPHPDPNPLDCNGHGSHVAGTAAGSGVTAAGNTYTGTYNATTVSANDWTIGPGVAPKADIYAVRVFGCNGSSDVVVDAIDWAVENEMDVISMSLGTVLLGGDSADAVASTNAAKFGIVVVAAAGNAGQNAYVTGSPASADGAISVAANDPIASTPGAQLALSTGSSILTQNSNKATFADGTSYPVAVLRASYPSGSIALGCSQAEYAAYPGAPGTLTGKMIVTHRGTCSRVARAIFAQMNGAAASAMINNAAGYPPFEGPITNSIETGPFNVTIPFFGVQGTPADPDGTALIAADGGTAVATNSTVPNPNFTGFARFTSGGPRNGDSFLKPDLTAPGVSIVSTLSGSGNGATTESGTSMATPHVSGSAVLTRQAHPTWSVEDIKAAMQNTGNPSAVLGYATSLGGTGLVQPASAAATQVVAEADVGQFIVSLNYGYAELDSAFLGMQAIELKNSGSIDAAFTVAEALPTGAPHTVRFDHTRIVVPAGGVATLNVGLIVPVETVGDANGSGLSFHEVAGLVVFTPVTPADNLGVTLRVPLYLVPRASSSLATSLGALSSTTPTATATVTNMGGAIAGNADFYAWGLKAHAAPGDGSFMVRAVGVQSFPLQTDQALVFAVSTVDRWSSPSANEFQIDVDVDGDGTVDYIIVGTDQGALENGLTNGIMASYVFSTRSAGATSNFFATAPSDRSIAELPVLASQLCRTGEPCLSATNPRITYTARSFDLIKGGMQTVRGSAKFNAFSNAISTGAFVTVPPFGTDSSTVITLNPTEFALTPPLGLMIVTLDNHSGEPEAQLIGVGTPTGMDGNKGHGPHDGGQP